VHNCIYQISTTPVKQEDYITESDFADHPFIGSVADCVGSSNDRGEDLRGFISMLGYWEIAHVTTVTEDSTVSFALVPGAKEKYFAGQYKAFVAARDKTVRMGLSEFASGFAFENALGDMDAAFCTNHETYVALGVADEYDLMPLDSFIRHAEIGTYYHIGNTLDYHY
jgi:hypothetical protein